ncbi:FAD/NAD(P)-binding protein [Roseobacter weihaiensis]|uniref:FAD/NAD(P)-binding protein n=1 Tax=Roseobacter weihaiensis TaxID=2763262 RepID=UPI001D0A251E|nr:FAD/NAD(P)-binding domain-containing protein [Roseobacter sp. H9]
MTKSNFDLAIVGLGPRGHYALERFAQELSRADTVKAVRILLVEETEQLGNGPVWDLSQPDSNWSNVNDRILELPARPEINLGTAVIKSFPSYHDWAVTNPAARSEDNSDHYPPRNAVGTYLYERFATLLHPLVEHGIANLVQERADAVALTEIGACVTARSGVKFFADQVLLTVGHQPTQQDPQIESWQAEIEARDAVCLFDEPYPVGPIVDAAKRRTKTTVAVRGYGLATIDVVRAIADAHGSFSLRDEKLRELKFTPTKEVAPTIIPFSLDGLPMGPKPITEQLDRQFAPSEKVLEALGRELSDPELQARAKGKAFLLDAITPVIIGVFRGLEYKRDDTPSDNDALHHLVKAWIEDPAQGHKCFLDTGQPPIDLLKNLVQMANGSAPVSLDYCIGQVWRHCHPTIYRSLSHSALSDEVLADIIFTDESMKRYAFGPPMESLQQLIALYEAGMLDLEYLADPGITVTDRGWVLTSGEDHTTAQVMVNAVLDAPKIADVRSPLIEGLLQDGLVAPVHDELGVATTADGYVISQNESVLPIAVLGRLAKGTIIGVDAILECFGDRPRAWASSAAKRAAINPIEAL